jgi:hypothetical protein
MNAAFSIKDIFLFSNKKKTGNKIFPSFYKIILLKFFFPLVGNGPKKSKMRQIYGEFHPHPLLFGIAG